MQEVIEGLERYSTSIALKNALDRTGIDQYNTKKDLVVMEFLEDYKEWLDKTQDIESEEKSKELYIVQRMYRRVVLCNPQINICLPISTF